MVCTPIYVADRGRVGGCKECSQMPIFAVGWQLQVCSVRLLDFGWPRYRLSGLESGLESGSCHEHLVPRTTEDRERGIRNF